MGELYEKDGVQGIVYLLTDGEGAHGMIVSLSEAERPWSTVEVETFAKSARRREVQLPCDPQHSRLGRQLPRIHVV